MKKTMLKVTAAALLLGQLLTAGGGGFQENATAASAADSNTAKPVPVMTDNLFKYGLKKDVELPVTVTAGGLSYTLEKIMIYDTKSKDAQALIKKYDYVLLEDSKYFIWTKITVENKSMKIIQRNVKDLSHKWRLGFGDLSYGGGIVIMPNANVKNQNSKQALWDWSLKPGEKLSTYQAYSYGGEFNLFYLRVDNRGERSSIDVAEKKA
jgi:hypothetical protein